MEKLPCETIVWNTLPAIRAAIAVEMVRCGLSQKMVASILGMAPSAVSQYLSGKRGYRIVFSDEVSKAIALNLLETDEITLLSLEDKCDKTTDCNSSSNELKSILE